MLDLLSITCHSQPRCLTRLQTENIPPVTRLNSLGRWKILLRENFSPPCYSEKASIKHLFKKKHRQRKSVLIKGGKISVYTSVEWDGMLIQCFLKCGPRTLEVPQNPLSVPQNQIYLPAYVEKLYTVKIPSNLWEKWRMCQF